MEVLTKYGEIARAAAAMTTLLAVCKVLLGLLNCFLGYKLLKVWVSLCGFFIGLTMGLLAVPRFTQESSAVGWISLGIGVVSGILAYEIYFVGVFAVGWLMTVSLCFSLGRVLVLDDKKKIFLLVAGALVGIFVGVLLVIFARPSIILFTAVSGGFSVSSGLFGLLHWETPLYLFLAGICLTVCGMGIQWKTTK